MRFIRRYKTESSIDASIVTGVWNATIFAKLENDLFATSNLSIFGSSGSPVLNNNGKLIGIIKDVHMTTSGYDQVIEVQVSNGANIRFPYKFGLFSYSIINSSKNINAFLQN
jgi:hypothetical protein